MRIIGGMIIFGVLLFAGIPAASACVMLQVDAIELQHCIDKMSDELSQQQLEIRTLDMAIDAHDKELCLIATKLDQVSPGDDLAAAFCPKRKAKPPPGKSLKR